MFFVDILILFWLLPCAVVALILVLTNTTKSVEVAKINKAGIYLWCRWFVIYPIDFFILLFAFLWVGGVTTKTFLYGRIKEVWDLAKRKGVNSDD